MNYDSLEILADEWARRLIAAWPLVPQELRTGTLDDLLFPWAEAAGVAPEIVELWGPQIIRAEFVNVNGIDPEAAELLRSLGAEMLKQKKRDA